MNSLKCLLNLFLPLAPEKKMSQKEIHEARIMNIGMDSNVASISLVLAKHEASGKDLKKIVI